MIKGVIFDMDGLMFDTERLWDTLWGPCCERLGLPAPTDAFLASGRGMAGDNLKRHLAAYYPQISPDALLAMVWKLADETFAEGVPCKPGLRELLDYLEQTGIPRIVASSSPRNLVETNLQTTGVRRYFHDIVCGGDVQVSKPDPAIFLLAASRLGLAPGECLVLEDSFNGVRAGHAAGAVTVMVPDMAQPTEEIRRLYDRCCGDLLEVLALLQQGAL
ncbi:MAG: HAD family hydrolase [Gemmiger sp.]